MTTITLLPEAVRQPATYLSCEFASPLDATQIAIVLTGRDAWGDAGMGEAVIALALEKNLNGQWAHVAGGRLARGIVQNEDGAPQTEARMELPLHSQQSPTPYYRVEVACYAVCPFACTAIFT